MYYHSFGSTTSQRKNQEDCDKVVQEKCHMNHFLSKFNVLLVLFQIVEVMCYAIFDVIILAP